VSPPDHGGEVWEVSSELGIPVHRILDFSANINPLGPSPRAIAAIRKSVRLVASYPDNNSRLLTQAVAAYVGGITPANVLIGNGVTELVHLFSKVFLGERTEAIIPQPTFSEYEYATALSGGRPVHIVMRNAFQLEPDVLLSQITRNTKAIFLCNPNNPTSTTHDRPTLEKVVREAGKSGIMVLLDESFVEFADKAKKLTLSTAAKNCRNLIVLRSLTKTFGLPGLRVGYAIGHEETIQLLDKFKITWSVNTLAQVAAIAALQDTSYIHATYRLISRERRFLEESLRELNLEITPPKANFLLARLRTSISSTELKRRLLKRGIIIRDCSRFKGLSSRFIRLAVRKRTENKILLRSLRKEIASL